jgi:hypothetical protein
VAELERRGHVAVAVDRAHLADRLEGYLRSM